MQCVLHGALEFFNSARLLRHCFRGRGMLGPRVATSSEFESFHSIRRGVVCETMEKCCSKCMLWDTACCILEF